MMILDAHCHLELFEKLPNAIPEQLSVITMTNTPKTVKKNKELFGLSNNIFVAVGLHPQLVSKRKDEFDCLLKLIDTHKFIGEIGIDGNSPEIEEQIYIFSELITHIDNLGNRVVSIHSKRADRLVIDLLSSLISRKSNIYILHWFSGSQSSLQKAINLGCYFSVNPKMCHSKSGIEIIKKIPSDRLLVESDAPFSGKLTSLFEVEDELLKTINDIEEIRKEKLLEIISNNSKKIIKY